MHAYTTFSIVLSAVLSLAACDGEHPAGAGGGPATNGTGGASVTTGGGLPGAPCTTMQARGPGGVATMVPGVMDATGACCAGCLTTSGECLSTTCLDSADCGDAHACGHGGAACVDCDDHNPCTDDVCAESGCAHYVYLGMECGSGKVCVEDGGCGLM